MSLSAKQQTSEREVRILRGVGPTQAPTILSTQLEECAPGEPGSVDPRLRERSIEEGRKIGFERGYQDGIDAAQSQVQQQLGDLRHAIVAVQQAAIAFQQQEIDLLSIGEDDILDSVFAIAHAVLQHEVSLQESPGREALKRALALAPNGQGAIAYLNPADAAQIEQQEIETEGRTIRIVANNTIERGGCVLEVGATRIDSQLSTALERMREVMQ